MAGIQYNPLVNGVAYDWSHVIINVLGRTVIGVKSLDYAENQDITDNYGAGIRPTTRGYGNIKCTCKLTLTTEEVLALEQLSVTGSLQDIPMFDITVQYMSYPTYPITDYIKNCQFKNNDRKLKQNDMEFPIELEIIASHVLWNQ
jgi:hypothetical protein